MKTSLLACRWLLAVALPVTLGHGLSVSPSPQRLRPVRQHGADGHGDSAAFNRHGDGADGRGDFEDLDPRPEPKQEHVSNVGPAVLMSCIAGLSTVLGALVVVFIDGGPPPTLMALTLGLAAGVMVTVSALELWPKDHSSGGYGIWGQLGAAAVGAAFYFVVSCLCPSPEAPMKESVASPEAGQAPSSALEIGASRQKAAERLWVVLFIVLTAHNVPEGLAVALTSLESKRLGFIVMLAIAMHNIPEGLTIAVTIRAAGGTKMKALLMALLSGLSEPLGAIIAIMVLLPYLTEWLIALMMCFVAGVMVTVAFSELIPEAIKWQRHTWTVLGLLIGATVMYVTHLYAE